MTIVWLARLTSPATCFAPSRGFDSCRLPRLHFISSWCGSNSLANPIHFLLSPSPAAGCRRQALLRSLKSLHSLAASPSIIKPRTDSWFLLPLSPPTNYRASLVLLRSFSVFLRPKTGSLLPLSPRPNPLTTATMRLSPMGMVTLWVVLLPSLALSSPVSFFLSRTRGS